MSLFTNKSLVKELSESKAAFSNLEKEFTDFKAAHADFEAKREEFSQKLSAYETEVAALKSERDTLSADLATAKASVNELSVKAESVTSAALVELEKVGQPALEVAPISTNENEGKLWDEYMVLRGKGEIRKARAFYEKNIKGKHK